MEAGFKTGMAGRPSDLIHFEQEGVPIAIEINLFNFLKISRGLPFDPNFLARPRPEGGLLCFQRLFPRLSIHITQHQDLVGGGLLDDHRDEPIPFLEIDLDHASSPFQLQISDCRFRNFKSAIPIPCLAGSSSRRAQSAFKVLP